MLKRVAVLVDQGLSGLSQLFLHIALVRWLSVGDYAAFAFAYSIFVLAVFVQNAFVLEPLLVFGARLRAAGQIAFYKAMLRLNWAVCLMFGSLVALALHVFGLATGRSTPGIEALFSLALVGGVGTFTFFRRLAYARNNAVDAALQSAVYIAALVLILACAKLQNSVGVVTGFVAAGAAGILSAAVGWLLEGPAFRSGSVAGLRKVIAKIRPYTKWTLIYAPVAWFVMNGLYLLIPFASTAGELTTFRGAMNVYLAFHQVTVAMSAFLLPKMSLLTHRDGNDAAWTHGQKEFSGLLALAIAYSAIVAMFEDELVALIFGNSTSKIVVPMKAGLLLPPIFVVLSGMLTYLRSSLDVKAIAVTYFYFGALPAMLVFPVAAMNGAVGAFWGLTVILSSCCVGFFLTRLLSRR